MESGDDLGYNESATGVNLGTESAISADKRTFFGAGFNFSNDNLYVNSTTMTGSRYMGGLVHSNAKPVTGLSTPPNSPAASPAINPIAGLRLPSQSISDADGATGYGTIATPDVQAILYRARVVPQRRRAFAKALQAARRMDAHAVPRAQRHPLYMSPMSESGAGGLSITTQATSDSFVTLQPGVQFSGDIADRGAAPAAPRRSLRHAVPRQ